MSRAVIAFVTDLIFATKIGSTARSLGRELRFARDLATFQRELAAAASPVCIIDLNVTGTDPIEAIRAARNVRGSYIYAYLSHVQGDLAAAARAAGADKVLARSTFSERLPSILSDATHSAPSGESPP